MKFQSHRWITLMGKPPSWWQKPLHRNTYLRIGNHAFNLTTGFHLEYHKVMYSHSINNNGKWVTKTTGTLW